MVAMEAGTPPALICAACGKAIAEHEPRVMMPSEEWIHTPCPPENTEARRALPLPDPVASGQLGT